MVAFLISSETSVLVSPATSDSTAPFTNAGASPAAIAVPTFLRAPSAANLDAFANEEASLEGVREPHEETHCKCVHAYVSARVCVCVCVCVCVALPRIACRTMGSRAHASSKTAVPYPMKATCGTNACCGKS
eukprot:5198644-Amphidinium_carterae.3